MRELHPSPRPSRARLSRAALLAGATLLGGAQQIVAAEPAVPPTATATLTPVVLTADASAIGGGSSDGDTTIVVTARNRMERLQDVPIPISVLGAATVDKQHVYTLADVTQRTPGLTATTPNARRTGVSLRGIGKTSGNDNMEAAVGVIVDDVFLDHVGMTYQDFTDLERIEVLRGPQGTLLGKNTSLGVIKYTSKQPSFTPQGSLELEGGLDRKAFKTRGSYSDALVPDLLAFRGSFFVDKQDGDIVNVNPAVGGRWHEFNRWGGRGQLLLTPADKFAVKLNIDAAATHENSNTKPFMVDPTTLNDGSLRTTTYSTRLARSYFGGYVPIIGAWRRIDLNEAKPLTTRNYGGSLVATWNTRPVEIKSITAQRWFHFDATNDQDQTRFSISRSGTLVDTQQFSQELRFAGKMTDAIDYQAGFYFLRIETESTSRSRYGADAGAFYATGAQYTALNTAIGRPFLQASLANTISTNKQHPVSTSEAAFVQANWKLTDRATLTGGIRYTREQKTNSIDRVTTFSDGSALASTGNATADAIRATQLGTPFAAVLGTPIDSGAVAWLVNPSYKLSKDILLYASASGGGKSGAVAFDNNGTRRNVDQEKTTDFELGIKGQLGRNLLWLSVNLYHTRVRDYQAVTSIPDAASTTGYSSVLGNIPGIRARGVELDGTLTPLPGLTINFSGAYNDATYSDWSNATCPRSFPTTVVVCDNTGRQIVSAPKWTGIIGFNYEHALGGSGLSLYAYGNNTYRTQQDLEQLLSPYGVQKAYHLVDAGLGVITHVRGVRTQIGVAAKNLFDKRYTTSVNDFSNSAPVGYDGIGPRRFVSALLRASF